MRPPYLGIDQMEPDKKIPDTLTPDQKEEFDRRDAELDANPSIALTWEQIRRSVEKNR